MPANVYTLDTNVASAIIKDEQGATDKLRRTPGVCTTVIAAGELLFGASRSAAAPKLMPKVLALLKELPIVNLSSISAGIWGMQKAHIEARGITIPDNDLWIAAIALEYKLIVATRDKHFDYIEGLKVERW